MRSPIKKFEPAVDKRILIFLAGIVWSIVGIMLCRLALIWLAQIDEQQAFQLGLAGFFLALIVHHFMFLKLLYKNLARILSIEGKACVFAFQPLKSYLIVAVMIGMGITLRHSSMPKPDLAVIYIGFGGAMLLSSLVYYWHFFKQLRK